LLCFKKRLQVSNGTGDLECFRLWAFGFGLKRVVRRMVGGRSKIKQYNPNMQ
jgi:hypothetical protein